MFLKHMTTEAEQLGMNVKQIIEDHSFFVVYYSIAEYRGSKAYAFCRVWSNFLLF